MFKLNPKKKEKSPKWERKRWIGKTNHIRCIKYDLPCEIINSHSLEQFDKLASWQALKSPKCQMTDSWVSLTLLIYFL